VTSVAESQGSAATNNNYRHTSMMIWFSRSRRVVAVSEDDGQWSWFSSVDQTNVIILRTALLRLLSLQLLTNCAGVPAPPGKFWISCENSRTWKVPENRFGLGN